MIRRFKLNTHLTMPLGLLAAPGAEYHRGEPGSVVEIDAARCDDFDRFIRGRIRAGDLTEINQSAAQAATPVKE